MGPWDYRYLVSLSTHRDYLRQGVASALIDWGLAQADKENLPTMLESVPDAIPVYLRKGFEVVEDFVMPYDEKNEKGEVTGTQGKVVLTVMVRQPGSS